MSFLCPCPFPALCPASRCLLLALWPAPCACPAPLPGLGALPVPLPSLLVACALASPLRSSLGRFPCPLPSLTPRSRSQYPAPPAPPLPDHVPSVLLPLCVGTGGRTGRGLFWGKVAFGGYGLGGLVRVWLSLVWERYLVPSLPSARAAAAPGEALGARAGPVPRAGGIVGAAA